MAAFAGTAPATSINPTINLNFIAVLFLPWFSPGKRESWRKLSDLFAANRREGEQKLSVGRAAPSIMRLAANPWILSDHFESELAVLATELAIARGEPNA